MPASIERGALGAGPAEPERPTKSEAPAVAAAQGFEAREQSDTPDSAAERKRLATARAALAIGGHQVHELAGGGFLVLWRGWSRHCRDLPELEAHARRVGVL